MAGKASSRKPTPAKKPAAPARSSSAAPSRAAQAATTQGRPAPVDPPQPAQQQPGTAVAAPRVQLPADTSIPQHMQQYAGAGVQGLGQQDMEIPRLKLMQALSKELEQFNDLRPGNWLHTAEEFIFDEPFKIVPIFLDKRYILWKPLEAGGGILARADDGIHWSPAQGTFNVTLDKKDGGAQVEWKLAPTVAESGLANWGTLNPNDTNSPPAATLMYNYLVVFPDHPDLMPAVMSLQRSSIKTARRFNTKLKTNRAPIFGTVWEVRTTDDSNAANQDFKNVDIVGAGFVEDAAQFEQYRQMHEQFSKSGLSIKDIENAQDDAPAGGADAGQQEAHQKF